MVELAYTDGTVERLERCFRVLYADDPAGDRVRFVAQRRPGSPLRWLDPADIVNAQTEMPDGTYSVAEE